MALKAIHDSLDEIPEQYQDLYTEKGGKYELTGITGIKTQGDIDRIQAGLEKERANHKETKEKLAVWDGMDHEDVMKKLDRIPELEAASEGNLDEGKLEEIVNKRVEATINSRTAPLERQINQLNKTNEELSTENEQFKADTKRRTIHDAVRKAMTESKVIPEAHDDALMLAERVFDVDEEGKVLTKDNMGVTPGADPALWLGEIQEKRPHWWPASQGGGGRGGSSGGGGYADNPWSSDKWNMTKQGQVVREHGREKAEAMAKAAGTSLGGPKPEKKAS